MNRNKKSPTAVAKGLPFNRQAGAARHFKPVVAQLKSSVSAESRRPVAPPIYRPQQVPKVLQTKPPPPPVYVPQATPKAAQLKMPGGAANRKSLAAPQVYRPQQVPKVLQTKSSSLPQKFTAAPAQRKTVTSIQTNKPGQTRPSSVQLMKWKYTKQGWYDESFSEPVEKPPNLPDRKWKYGDIWDDAEVAPPEKKGPPDIEQDFKPAKACVLYTLIGLKTEVFKEKSAENLHKLFWKKGSAYSHYKQYSEDDVIKKLLSEFGMTLVEKIKPLTFKVDDLPAKLDPGRYAVILTFTGKEDHMVMLEVDKKKAPVWTEFDQRKGHGFQDAKSIGGYKVRLVFKNPG